MSHFSERFSKLLALKQIKPHDLALRIGIDPSYMSKVVNGIKAPGDPLLEKLASVPELGLDLKTLQALKFMDKIPPGVMEAIIREAHTPEYQEVVRELEAKLEQKKKGRK